MIKQPTTQEEKYLSAFQSQEKDGYARDPSWVRGLRRAAISRFKTLGFPAARRGNEEWKYTDIGPLAKAPLQPLVSPLPAKLKVGGLKRFIFGGSSWNRLVFVNGHYDRQLSSLPSLPVGVSVASLAEAIDTQASLVEQNLARYAAFEANAFTALNTAFVHDGAFVHIPDGTIVEEPIHLLFLSTSREQAAVSYPRVLLLAGKDSKATIIESYGGMPDSLYFANGVTEVVLDAGAVVRHYRLQRQSEQAFHIANTHAALAANSNYSSFTTDIGGGLVRNNLNVLMGGEGSTCTLNGIYLVTRSQHVDNQVIIDHAKPYCTSRELYKGVLDGKSRSVFHGSIIVRKDAVKTDARQEDKNLLLSAQAEADTKPAFWIYCDDVKCGHGAACGQMDEKALFYLRSRGIGERAARSLLTRGFVSEVISSVTYEPVRKYVDNLVMTTLREWLGQKEAA